VMSPPATGYAVPRPEALSFGRHKESSGLFVSGLGPLKVAMPAARQSRFCGVPLAMHSVAAGEHLFIRMS
jgi:hypothetical protein